jgi:transcription initiation factor IIE alpha subunit
MLLFVIAGVRSHTKNLGTATILCPNCGAYLEIVRNDAWATVFFVPIFRIHRGQRYCKCRRCGVVLPINTSSKEVSDSVQMS